MKKDPALFLAQRPFYIFSFILFLTLLIILVFVKTWISLEKTSFYEKNDGPHVQTARSVKTPQPLDLFSQYNQLGFREPKDAFSLQVPKISDEFTSILTEDGNFKIFYAISGPNKPHTDWFIPELNDALQEGWREIFVERGWIVPESAKREDEDGKRIHVFVIEMENTEGGSAGADHLNIAVNGLYNATREGLRIVTKHELTHLSQFEYLKLQENNDFVSWWGESSATWLSYYLEGQLNDQFSLIANYMTWYRWNYPDLGLFYEGVVPGPESKYFISSIYYSPIWIEYLREKFDDPEILRKIWEKFGEGNEASAAIDLVIKEKTRNESSLEKEFQEYTRWNYLKSYAFPIHDIVKVKIHKKHTGVFDQQEETSLPQPFGAHYIEIDPKNISSDGIRFDGDPHINWGITVLGFAPEKKETPSLPKNILKTNTIENISQITRNITKEELLEKNYVNISVPLWNRYTKVVLIIQNLDKEITPEFYRYTVYSSGDLDSDGLTLEQEEFYHTDANNPDTDGDKLQDGDEVNMHNTDPLSLDTDEDSVPDGWELQYGFNPNNSQDAEEDPDSDTLKNKEEYLWDKNPFELDTSIILDTEVLGSVVNFEDNKILWGASSDDIMLYDLLTKERKVVVPYDPYSRRTPPVSTRMSQGKLVWKEFINLDEKSINSQILLSDTEHSFESILVSSDTLPDKDNIFFSYPYVAFEGRENEEERYRVYLYNILNSSLESLSDEGISGSIYAMDNQYIVWQHYGETQAWLKNLQTGEKKSLPIYTYTSNMDIHNHRLVYSYGEGFRIYNILTNEVTLYNQDMYVSNESYSIDFFDDMVTWIEASNKNIFSYNLSTGERKQITSTTVEEREDVVVFDNIVLWQEFTDSSDSHGDLHAWYIDR